MENKEQLKLTKFRFWMILILALIGVGLCIELGYIFYKTNFLTQFAPSFCAVSELIDCDGVAQTSYALSMGIPNAIWGLVLYLVMIMLLFVDKIQTKFKNTIFDVFENPRSYIAFLGALSFIISMVLAFISIFKIEKICALCFVTYFINFAIALLANTKGFFLQDTIITIRDFIKGAKKYLILFLVVLTAFVSTLVYCQNSLIFSPKLKKEKLQKEFFEATKNKYAVKGNILGANTAKVVIHVYSDYNCPFCKVVHLMLHKAAREQNIIVEDVHFPLDTSCNKQIGGTLGGHENSCIYSKYALAAKKQGYLWPMADILFYKHPMNQDELKKYIEEAKLNINFEQLQKDAQSEEILEQLQKDIDRTVSKGIMGTPSLEINGVLYVGAMPYDELINRIKLAKKRAEN